MPIAEWTAQIPGDVDQEWQQRERAANRTDLNWVRYFFDYSQIPSEATNHFKEKFYCVQQREDQQKKGASFENIRKIAIYLLKLAPNAAIHSPGYNGQPGKPALLLGRATGNFQAPKFALVFNPSDIKDENFYASFQEGQGVTLNADAKSVSTNDKYKWKRLTNPIHLSANGDLIFKDDDQSLIHLKEFLENLNNYIIRNPHNEYNDTLRPDNLGSTSPVYPKLVGRKENNARSTPTTISSAPLPLPPNKMNINTILFGPPGTGKTYNTLVTALHALNYKNKKMSALYIHTIA